MSVGGVAAADEIILRKSIPFHACPAAVRAMLSSLQAQSDHVHLVTDTGAHYKIKLVAEGANLVFLCNAVAEQITITRTTPGELVASSN